MVVISSFDQYALDSSNFHNVADMKVFVAQRDSLPMGNIQFHIGNMPLTDNTPMSSLSSDAIIDVIVPLLGGKVHGSLARAGKVRGQTPKVAPAENKKKKKTGRAKRRIQYNRRFVAAVVQGPGRKRGPNSNAT